MKDSMSPEMWEKETGSSMRLGDILQLVKRKKRWFVLSVVVCVCLTLIYLMGTPNIYERKATVLIKDDRNAMTTGETALYQELTQINIANNTNNEVLIFKSYALMAEAVRRLQLDCSYKLKKGLFSRDLYTRTPIMIYFVEDVQHNFSLKLKILDSRRIEISGVVNGKRKSVIVFTNDTVETPFGKLVVVPTDLFANDSEWIGKTLIIEKYNFDDVTEHYFHSLNVALADKQSTVINLSLKDASAVRAEDILNTLIAVYNEDAINDKNQISINTENFINDRLAIIEQELGGVDQQIEEYKRKNRLTDIESNAKIYLEENRDYSRTGVDIRNQYSMAQYIKRYLVDASKKDQLIPANTGIQDVGIESQIETYNTRLLRRNRLIESGSDKNPVVQDLTTALTAERQNIIRAVDNLIVNLNIQLNNAKSKEQVALDNIASVPQQQKEVVSISRQQKIKEELYLFLLNKREENAISKAITENQLRIIDAATGSNRPVAPQKGLLLCLAVLLGLLIPLGIIYVRSLLDVYVRNRKDLTRWLSVPFLGSVPQKEEKGLISKLFARKKKSAENSKVDLVVQEKGQDVESEAFRLIGANLNFMRANKADLKVLMTTSANTGAGKSFVAANMALSLAQTGKNILLVDMNIRKGSLTRGLGYSFDNRGLTSYLSAQTSSADEIINHGVIHPNVDTMFCGPMSLNPVELLLDSRLDNLINELRSRYDYIILDSMPIGEVADSLIANRVVDLTLFVVDAGVTNKHLLPEIEQLYKSNRLKNMALILNGTEAVCNDDN